MNENDPCCRTSFRWDGSQKLQKLVSHLELHDEMREVKFSFQVQSDADVLLTWKKKNKTLINAKQNLCFVFTAFIVLFKNHRVIRTVMFEQHSMYVH